jgi:sugar phosphate isomerase/epimerase
MIPELSSDPKGVRKMLADQKIELVCLGSSVTLDSKSRTVVNRMKEELTEFIELAARLGCPYVRMFTGEVQRFDNLQATQGRIAEALASIVPVATRNDVTVLVENGSDFPGSEALWFLVDAVDHPSVKCCWNQCQAMTTGERPTISIPRLGSKIEMVHICDAAFDPSGVLTDYTPLGQGDVEIARQIELLKGLALDTYLMFEWPKMWVESLPNADDVLPTVANYLRERIDEKQPVLSAYKGDKNAPRLRTREPISNTSK